MKDGVFFTHQVDVYDWYGKLLNPEIRNAITVNNIVRISVNHSPFYSEGIYVQVTAVEGLDLVGIVQDTYRHFFEEEIIYSSFQINEVHRSCRGERRSPLLMYLT